MDPRCVQRKLRDMDQAVVVDVLCYGVSKVFAVSSPGVVLEPQLHLVACKELKHLPEVLDDGGLRCLSRIVSGRKHQDKVGDGTHKVTVVKHDSAVEELESRLSSVGRDSADQLLSEDGVGLLELTGIFGGTGSSQSKGEQSEVLPKGTFPMLERKSRPMCVEHGRGECRIHHHVRELRPVVSVHIGGSVLIPALDESSIELLKGAEGTGGRLLHGIRKGAAEDAWNDDRGTIGIGAWTGEEEFGGDLRLANLLCCNAVTAGLASDHSSGRKGGSRWPGCRRSTLVLGDEGVVGVRVGTEPRVDIVVAHVVEPGQEVLATSGSGWGRSRGEEHGRPKGSIVVEAVAERGRNVGSWVLEGNSSPPHVGMEHHLSPLGTVGRHLVEPLDEGGDVIDGTKVDGVESVPCRKGEHDREDRHVVVGEGGFGIRDVMGEGEGVFNAFHFSTVSVERRSDDGVRDWRCRHQVVQRGRVVRVGGVEQENLDPLDRLISGDADGDRVEERAAVVTEDNLAIVQVRDEDGAAHDFEGTVFGEEEGLAGDEGDFTDGRREVLDEVHDGTGDLGLVDCRGIRETAGSGELLRLVEVPEERRERSSVGVKVGMVLVWLGEVGDCSNYRSKNNGRIVEKSDFGKIVCCVDIR